MSERERETESERERERDRQTDKEDGRGKMKEPPGRLINLSQPNAEKQPGRF